MRSEQPVTCADSEPEPDISVVRGSEYDFLREHPKTCELIIEICVPSHEYDRWKLKAYASAGVKEVWLILRQEKLVEIYRKPVAGQFAQLNTYGPGGCVASESVLGFELDLDALFDASPQS
jgi:Uma2 family endonuclease